MKVKLDNAEVWSDSGQQPRDFYQAEEQEVVMYACEKGDDHSFVIELPPINEDDYALLIYLTDSELARAVGFCKADRALS